jgi:outer membrane lipoprotein-sorting protein
MKSAKFALILVTAFLVSDLNAQQEQQRRSRAGGGMGGPPQPRFGEAMTKLFGENQNFSADVNMEMKMENSTMTMPGKLSFSGGKSRFEMDTTKMKGGNIPPGAAEQMKQMGMAEMVNITRPDKKESYIVYPGLKAYAVMPTTEGESKDAAGADKTNIKKTELGKETVDGHPTTKSKVVLKDAEGKETEFTVWNASDMKDFPIKMETVNEGVPAIITYKEVKLEKPDDALFEPPADFQRYTDVSTMMRETMMKRFAPPGGAAPGGGVPPPRQ